MKKATLTAIVAILILLSVGMQSAEISRADSLDLNQPRIILHSPTPIQVYNSSIINLSLEIVKPSSWFYSDYWTWNPLGSWPPNPKTDYIRGYGCYGRIDYIECILDGKINQTFPIDDCTPHVFYKNQLSTKLRFSQTLSVAEGRHLLKITAFGSFYPDRFSSDPYRTRQIVNCSVTTSFSVWYTSPQISVISPQDATYSEVSVPVTFELDRPASCVYSLDGAGNVSLAGNITLSGLVEGSHSLVIYAKDPAGNVGKSDTVMFNVVLPTPAASSSSSLYPSLTSTLEPSSTNSPAGNLGANCTLPILVGIVCLLVILGLIFYFKRKRR